MIETRISVRNLVEFILRSGDIDNRISSGSESALLEGTRIHKMIQKRAGSDYRAEVPLAIKYTEDDMEITVEGRADGIIDNASGVTIDEIKSTYADVMKYKEAWPVHLAQAKFYAYIYAVQNDLMTIKVRLTYVNIDTEEIRYFNFTYLKEELIEFAADVLKQYIKWARFEAEWIEKRNNSIKGLPFPFEYRDGQAELVKQVYYTIYHQKKLFLEAPTGVGKTISTMYPAIQAMGQQFFNKLFYLTAKTITRTVADDTVSIMRDKGLKAKSLILTAKEKICMIGETDCNPDACPYAKGHYDRVNDAVFALLTEKDRYTRDTIYEYAERFKVCPFEMSLDVSLFTDVIICDYNYAFDPSSKLKRFFGEEVIHDKPEFLFLIDESHNLVDRAREMYSAAIVKEDLMHLKRLTAEEAPAISKRLEKCNKLMLELKHDCAKSLINPPISELTNGLSRLYAAIDDFLEEERKKGAKSMLSREVKDALLDYYFEINHYLNMYELVDENYCVYAAYNDEGDFYVKLFCVNPSKNLSECMKFARSTILFSATFLPIMYYKNLLGGTKEDYEVYAESIFDPSKRGLFIANDVTTKYTRRSEDEYTKIAEYIHETVSGKKGNYMAFFPSYGFLENVYNAYMRIFGDEEGTELLIQTSGMSEEEREDFLNRFTGNGSDGIFDCIDMDIEIEEESTIIGFCVMGGIFSEGIDLKNDSLIGAIIVGTGLPQVCLEREIMKETFDDEGADGFDYAYRYPGMNKVLQSAGRVIRTENDIGIVVLLDERFLQPSYKKMFPREWSNMKIARLNSLGDEIKKFWDNHS